MKRIELVKVQHNKKVGDTCTDIRPNITEDVILMENGRAIGFYIRDVRTHSDKLGKFLDIANMEFRSKRVPKSVMTRSSALNARREGGKGVEQYSTIIGSVPPKPHMRRPYPTRSSVHSVKSADMFVKSMLLAAIESENLIKQLTPELYELQIKTIADNVPEQWRFSKGFTSSISNYNIAAAYHIDTANLHPCLNVILSKKENAYGGDLSVPDYDAVFFSGDYSMVVYPAWKSLHGVTPIVPTALNGYRNSFVFYPLKAFKYDEIQDKNEVKNQ
jgi:hypothetical protein